MGTIREFLFDLGQRTFDMVPHNWIIDSVIHINTVDPEGARILFQRLLELGLVTTGHELPHSAA
jgi:hypothetical protein